MVWVFYWDQLETRRELQFANDRMDQLYRDLEDRETITVYVPINDTSGTLAHDRHNFVFGVLLQGNVLTENGENIFFVENVPRSTIYHAFGFHRQGGSRTGSLVITPQRAPISEGDIIPSGIE